jgi:hypothetical protein
VPGWAGPPPLPPLLFIPSLTISPPWIRTQLDFSFELSSAASSPSSTSAAAHLLWASVVINKWWLDWLEDWLSLSFLKSCRPLSITKVSFCIRTLVTRVLTWECKITKPGSLEPQEMSFQSWSCHRLCPWASHSVLRASDYSRKRHGNCWPPSLQNHGSEWSKCENKVNCNAKHRQQ